ncbi:MAG: ATP-grasp domain-containing protein [Myxococcota bacterium]
MRAAIATCAEVPNLDEDGPLLVQALAHYGIEAEPAIWDDPAVAWPSYDLVVIRSTWDYPSRWRSFLDWIDAVETPCRLLNPADVVRWNIDKRYLRSLARHGIPVVPTQWLEDFSASVNLTDKWRRTDEVVVKPAVSAGSKDTRRFARNESDAAAALARDILASGRPVMLQPYMGSVDDRGETALLYFGGRYSHAIRKGPLLAVGDALEAGLFRQEEIEPRVASDEERALGELVLDRLPFERDRLAYARVDLVQGAGGTPSVIEIELIEPSVFLQHAPGAADRFASALAAGARRGENGAAR